VAAGTALGLAVGAVLGVARGRRSALRRLTPDVGAAPDHPPANHPPADHRGDRPSAESFGRKARAAARLAAERLGDGVAARLGWRDADAAADALAHDLATEMAALLHDRRPVPLGAGRSDDRAGARRVGRHHRHAHRVAQRSGPPAVPGSPAVPVAPTVPGPPATGGPPTAPGPQASSR